MPESGSAYGRSLALYPEDDLIPISSLQHALFCERQFALIHIERTWEDNRFTIEGELLHERVDIEGHENRRLFRQEFAMQVKCDAYGLTGKCDLVEIRLTPEGAVAEAIPVEFKRGVKKEDDRDRVQLCAQALCLEEMLGIPVPTGQFYYLKEHRRMTTQIDGELRATTIKLIGRVRGLLADGRTPQAFYDRRKCDACSLIEQCMPKSAGSGAKRVDRYIASQLKAVADRE
jgi:CRISPR-associated exonuclease Cas4